MATTPKIQNRPASAIGLKLCAIFLFMVMAALVKTATETVPPGQAVFFRALFSVPVILFWVWQRGEIRNALIPQNLMGHVWRGLFGTTAMGLTFFSLGQLPLPEVTAIGYATPMFAVMFAALMLKERVGVFRISAVAIGLVGVVIMIWPRLTVTADTVSSAGLIAALMVLVAAILRALVQIHVRTLVQTEHTAAIVLYFALTASLLSLLSLPFGWVLPTGQESLLLVGAGVIGGIAQILITSSYRFGSASMLAPFDYSSMVFAAVIGYFVFAELPTQEIWIGSALVIAGGGVIIWRERQLGLKGGRARARAVSDPKG